MTLLQGDSACPVESAFLYINKGNDLSKADAVRVVVLKDLGDKDQTLKGTPDVQLLARLCADNDWSPDASERVLAYESIAPNVSAAMPRVSPIVREFVGF